MRLLTIEATLNKSGSDFKGWNNGANTKIIRAGCPRCKSDMICAYDDMGLSDYCDTYNHICMNSSCDYMNKKDILGVGMGSRDTNGPAYCPFCGRVVSC